MTIASEQNQLQNPVKKFISFKTDKFVYWDKEKEKEVEVPMPLEFIAIDELKTVKGWHDKTESGIYSNEVHDLRFEKLNVKSFKGGELESGIWSEIKGDIKAHGGKFGVSIYSYLNGELVNLQLSGASLSSWIEKGDSGIKFKVEKLGEGKKGKVEYKFPIFEALTITKEEKEKPIEILNDILTPYFEAYKKKQNGDDKKEVIAEVVEEKPKEAVKNDIPLEDLPF